MTSVGFVESTIVWDGRCVETVLHQEVKKGKYTYWEISISKPNTGWQISVPKLGGWEISAPNPNTGWEINAPMLGGWEVPIEKIWVIRRLIKDLRPVIADEIKTIFQIPKLGTLTTTKGKKVFLLIRSYDPNVTPELTLQDYMKQDRRSQDLQEQVQRIYAFRMVLGMSVNIDSSLCIRLMGRRPVVYSLYDSFPEEIKKPIFPEAVYNKWFESQEEIVTISDRIADMIGAPRPDKEDQEGRLEEATDRISTLLEPIVRRICPDLVWFESEIINKLICKVTP